MGAIYVAVRLIELTTSHLYELIGSDRMNTELYPEIYHRQCSTVIGPSYDMYTWVLSMLLSDVLSLHHIYMS